MEDVFGRLGEILKPQFDLLNEAERNGDDIIVKLIVYESKTSEEDTGVPVE